MRAGTTAEKVNACFAVEKAATSPYPDCAPHRDPLSLVGPFRHEDGGPVRGDGQAGGPACVAPVQSDWSGMATVASTVSEAASTTDRLCPLSAYSREPSALSAA